MTEWIGYAIGVLGVAVAVAAWLRPRHAARRPRNKVVGDIVVDTSNGWLMFDHADGSSSLSDHLVIVTVRNVGHDRALLKNWGISVAREGNIVDLGSLKLNPALPRWLDPGRTSRSTYPRTASEPSQLTATCHSRECTHLLG